jgi:hypothetical protein
MAYVTEDLINDIQDDHEGTSKTLGNSAAQRLRITRAAQRAADFIWNFRDWPWAYTSGTVSVAATEDIAMPATVGPLGKDGGIWISDSNNPRPPLQWIPYHRFRDLALSRGRTAEPRVYAEAGQGASDEKRWVLLYPFNDATRTFAYSARLLPPTLVDESSPSSDKLFLIPLPWRRTVVYEWTVYYLMKEAGNIQSRSEQLQLAQEALSEMVREERTGRQAPHNLGPYGRRRGGRGAGRLYV